TAGNQKLFCTEFHSSRRHPTSSPDNLATSPATLNPQKAWLLLSLLLAVLNLTLRSLNSTLPGLQFCRSRARRSRLRMGFPSRRRARASRAEQRRPAATVKS